MGIAKRQGKFNEKMIYGRHTFFDRMRHAVAIFTVKCRTYWGPLSDELDFGRITWKKSFNSILQSSASIQMEKRFLMAVPPQPLIWSVEKYKIVRRKFP